MAPQMLGGTAGASATFDSTIFLMSALMYHRYLVRLLVQLLLVPTEPALPTVSKYSTEWGS